MKKLLTTVFLVAALVMPAFATESKNLELIPKVGYLFTPEYKIENYTTSKESAISLGAELLFNLQNNFFIGGGFMWGSTHKLDDKGLDKMGFSNIYATAKYKFLVNGSEEKSLFLYPLAQIGFGIIDYDSNDDPDIKGGLYWALGIGAEFNNIILELVYGCNNATVTILSYDYDFTYTAFRVNVGYKFEL